MLHLLCTSNLNFGVFKTRISKIPIPSQLSLLLLLQRDGNLNTHFSFLQNPIFKSISNSPQEQSSSFTVSYLINSCGLSSEAALKATKKLHLQTTHQPDSVLNFFKNHGFTQPQISHIISKLPHLLLSNPQKTIHPKLQFLNQLGFSESTIAKLVASGSCSFLNRSLHNLIIPSFHLLKTLLHDNDLNVLFTIQKSFSMEVLQLNLHKDIKPKIHILQIHGVPEENIPMLLMFGRRVLSINTNLFEEVVKLVVEMGIKPSTKMFIYAVRALSATSKTKRDARKEIYRSFGWSDAQICMAITKQPTCITIAEEKLRIGLDFFMNHLKFDIATLINYPNMLGFSMERRILPRLRVIEFLISKGLIKNDINIASTLMLSETNFTKKFVAKYVGGLPQLTNLYRGSMLLMALIDPEIYHLNPEKPKVRRLSTRGRSLLTRSLVYLDNPSIEVHEFYFPPN